MSRIIPSLDVITTTSTPRNTDALPHALCLQAFSLSLPDPLDPHTMIHVELEIPHFWNDMMHEDCNQYGWKEICMIHEKQTQLQYDKMASIGLKAQPSTLDGWEHDNTSRSSSTPHKPRLPTDPASIQAREMERERGRKRANKKQQQLNDKIAKTWGSSTS